MYALLAHMRETPERTKQVVFSVRQMTCFNGFNTSNAFAFIRQERTLLCDLSEENVFGGSYHDIPAVSLVDDRPGYSRWECLGIGWLDYSIAAGEDVAQVMERNPKVHPRQFALALNNERCGRYVAEGEGSVNTKRVLTPNELILAGIFNWFSQTSNQRADVRGLGFMLRALVTMRATRCMTFDFVGSERPSGQAVAYLQVFRNLSQESRDGWIHFPGMLNLQDQLARWTASASSIKSLVPLLSFLHNTGSDSDILSFAGSNVCAFMCQYGFWQHPELFMNPRSMLVEGRYNKGAQSQRLGQNFEELVRNARRLSGNSQLWPSTGSNPFADLKASVSAINQMNMLMSKAQVDLRIGREQRMQDDFLRALNDTIRSYWNSNPQLAARNFEETLRQLPDVSAVIPRRGTPELPTDGAAVGYRQWVETATVH